MPRVRQYTEQLREEQKRKIHAERTKRIVCAAADMYGVRMQDLAVQTGIEYQRLMRHLREGKLTVDEVTRLGRALRFDTETYAAVCGSSVRCRFEKGGAF